MRRHCLPVFIALFIALPCGAQEQAPYTPTSDAAVLESSLRHEASQSLRARQRALQSAAANLPAAIEFARRAVLTGSEEGDPRYFGYAQAALAAWWSAPAPDADVRLMRATILQWQHQFERARSDLDAIIAADAKDVDQAHLTRAAIEMVQGEPEAARRDCIALLAHAEALLTATCIASANAMLGQAAQSEAALRHALGAVASPSSAALVWAHTEIAEIDARLSRWEAAGAAYEQALKAAEAGGHRDPYLLSSYCDFLLDRGQPYRVVKMLAGLTRIDNLLLRLTLAEQALANTDPDYAARAAQHADEIERRFEETRARGDFVHQREQAIFLLKVKHDPRRALAVALDNWTKQRELTDARVLVQAARACGDAAAAQRVLDWEKRHGVEDGELERAS